MKKLILLIAMMSMFMIGIVNAIALTCAIIEPNSGDTLVDGSILNASFLEGDGNTTLGVIYTFASTSTANTSASFAPVVNLTGASLMANGSINSSFGAGDVLEDAADYTVTATVNGTACSGTATSVIVGRTTPSAPTTTQAAQSVLKAGSVLTYAVTGTDTTSCRASFQTSKVEKSSGTNTFAMVHSGDTCTYTIPSITIGDGVYSLRAWASDGTDATFSTPLDIEIDNIASNTNPAEDGLQVDIGKAVGEKIKGETIGTIAIILVIVYFVFNQKGSKRK